jgi:serine/threonine protein phosphatase PrpC
VRRRRRPRRGEIASQETVEFIHDWIRSDTTDIEIGPHPPARRSRRSSGSARWSAAPIQNACYMVHSMGEIDPERRGMSTTASVALVAAGVAIVGWVGDSRVYLARGPDRSPSSPTTTRWSTIQVKQGVLTPDQAGARR